MPQQLTGRPACPKRHHELVRSAVSAALRHKRLRPVPRRRRRRSSRARRREQGARTRGGSGQRRIHPGGSGPRMDSRRIRTRGGSGLEEDPAPEERHRGSTNREETPGVEDCMKNSDCDRRRNDDDNTPGGLMIPMIPTSHPVPRTTRLMATSSPAMSYRLSRNFRSRRSGLLGATIRSLPPGPRA